MARRLMLLKIIPGADPENFDLSKDGKQLYTSNEDISSLSIVDIATATVVKTIKMGGQPEGVRTSPKWEMCLRYVRRRWDHHGIRPCNGASISSFKVGHRPRSIAFIPDGKLAYLNAENDGGVVLIDVIRHKL